MAGAPIVYVHAKVSIFDDAAAIVGSANLNGRSLKWDTETAILWRDGPAIAAFRDRLWRTHFAGPAPSADSAALTAWRTTAEANLKAAPAARQGFLLPYDIAAAEAHASRRLWIPTNML